MLNNILLKILLLMGLPAFAQKSVLSYSTDIKSIQKTPCESFVVPDETSGKTSIVLKSDDKVEYLLLSKNLEIEAKVLPTKGLANTIFGRSYEQYLAGVRNNLGSCFYYMLDRNHFSMEVVDFANGTVINKPIFDKADEERNLQWFTSKGRFYLLTVNDKKGQLALHVVDENGVISHRNLTVDLNGFNRDNLSLSEYFSYSHVFYPKQEIELIDATDLTKIYPNSDNVIIIVVNDKEPPHVWNIDLQSYHVTKKKFDLSGFSGFNGNKEKFYNNSYLFGENLYVLNVSKQKIEIGVFNFSTGQLLKKHEINESSNIQYVDTPVEITTKGRFTKKNVITSNKELIKEMFKGSHGIAIARNANGDLILTCGVYDRETGSLYNGSFNESPFSTTGTFAKVTSMKNNGGFRSYTLTRTVNFKIILDSSEYKLVSSNFKLSTIDKMNHYLKSLPAETEATNIFRINGNYYLSYYLPKEKSFVIKEMEK